MKSAGTVPRGGIDVSDLKRLVEDGPFLSVYVPTESGVQNAAQKSETEWKALRQKLVDDGAPEEALAHVDPLVADAHLHGEMLAVIATADGVELSQHLQTALPQARGSWSPVADIVPIIKDRQDRVAYVTAWADHGGADICGYTKGGRTIETDVGDGDPQQKAAPGGWSQARYQRRADNEWAENASDAADEVRKMAERVGARTIIVGGDERATHMLADNLPRDVEVHIIEHGRAKDGSEQTREEEVRRLVNTAVAADTVAILEKFKEERGQLDRAVDGINATHEALNRAAVDVLLIHDDRDLLADGAGVIDSLARDAIATGATVRVIPAAGPVEGGVGAILRWA